MAGLLELISGIAWLRDLAVRLRGRYYALRVQPWAVPILLQAGRTEIHVSVEPFITLDIPLLSVRLLYPPRWWRLSGQRHKYANV